MNKKRTPQAAIVVEYRGVDMLVAADERGWRVELDFRIQGLAQKTRLHTTQESAVSDARRIIDYFAGRNALRCEESQL